MSVLTPPRSRVGLLVVAFALVWALLPITSASAGRLLLTGHDPDHHCGSYDDARQAQCHYFQVAVEYVRGGAVDPSKPVLLLDRAVNGNPPVPDTVKALDKAFGPGVVPRVVVEPRSDEFRTTSLSANDYSAIVIAASKDDSPDATEQGLNELNSTPDMDAINARAADIRAFFNRGGGIFVSSGGKFGREQSESFYGFLPVTVGGAAVQGPFSLTDLGRQIGFTDDDINCCRTHLSFQLPAPESPLNVAEYDRRGRAETLVADVPRLSDLREPELNPATIFAPVPPAARRSCRSRAALTISLRRPRRVRFQRITVFVNGKRVRRVGVRKLGTRRRTTPFRVRLRRGRTSRVRIVAVTTTGRRVVLRRTYRVCA